MGEHWLLPLNLKLESETLIIVSADGQVSCHDLTESAFATQPGRFYALRIFLFEK